MFKLSQFLVILSNKAEKGLKNSKSKIYPRLKEALDELEVNPIQKEKFDVTKISGSVSNYRIRIGKYRILYSINWEEKQIKVFDIDKRSDSTYS